MAGVLELAAAGRAGLPAIERTEKERVQDPLRFLKYSIPAVA